MPFAYKKLTIQTSYRSLNLAGYDVSQGSIDEQETLFFDGPVAGTQQRWETTIPWEPIGSALYQELLSAVFSTSPSGVSTLCMVR